MADVFGYGNLTVKETIQQVIGYAHRGNLFISEIKLCAPSWAALCAEQKIPEDAKEIQVPHPSKNEWIVVKPRVWDANGIET